MPGWLGWSASRCRISARSVSLISEPSPPWNDLSSSSSCALASATSSSAGHARIPDEIHGVLHRSILVLTGELVILDDLGQPRLDATPGSHAGQSPSLCRSGRPSRATRARATRACAHGCESARLPPRSPPPADRAGSWVQMGPWGRRLCCSSGFRVLRGSFHRIPHVHLQQKPLDKNYMKIHVFWQRRSVNWLNRSN